MNCISLTSVILLVLKYILCEVNAVINSYDYYFHYIPFIIYLFSFNLFMALNLMCSLVGGPQ